jgi:hypothetical protein
MSGSGPYTVPPPPEWWVQKVYEDQMRKQSQNNMQPGLFNYDNTPDVYIVGYRHDGKTGKLIK